MACGRGTHRWKPFREQEIVSWCFKVNLYSPARRIKMKVRPLAMFFHRTLHGKQICTKGVEVPLSSEYRWWDMGSWVGWCVVTER